MKLITKELEKQLPELYQAEKDPEAIVYVHYFSTRNGWDWYGYEYDKRSRTFFGLVDGFEVEFGYFTLDEFEEVNKKFGSQVIERDLHWKPKTLKEVRASLGR